MLLREVGSEPGVDVGLGGVAKLGMHVAVGVDEAMQLAFVLDLHIFAAAEPPVAQHILHVVPTIGPFFGVPLLVTKEHLQPFGN